MKKYCAVATLKLWNAKLMSGLFKWDARLITASDLIEPTSQPGLIADERDENSAGFPPPTAKCAARFNETIGSSLYFTQPTAQKMWNEKPDPKTHVFVLINWSATENFNI